jgi:hypothetical protein
MRIPAHKTTGTRNEGTTNRSEAGPKTRVNHPKTLSLRDPTRSPIHSRSLVRPLDRFQNRFQASRTSMKSMVLRAVASAMVEVLWV